MTLGPNVRGSIRRRLLLILLSGAVVLSLGLYFTIQNLALRLAEESQDNILGASVATILDAASVSQGTLDLDLPYSAFSMLSNVSNDRVFYAIRADDRFLTGYGDLPVLGSTPSAARYATAQYSGQEVRLLEQTRIMSVAGQPVRLAVTIAQTRDGHRELLSQVSRTAATAGAGVFVVVVALALISAQATVSPFIRLTESVGRRGPKELRPVAAPVPVEMAPLVGALNGFMDRLKTSLSRTEEFIADAAHRVRTPLATVRTRAETTLMRVEKEENRRALREMIRAIDESSRAAGQMLDHAMVSLRADDLEKAVVDLGVLASEQVDRLGPLAELRDIDLVLEVAAPQPIESDPILLQSALRNLLDNAIKYAPPESEIRVTVGRESDDAVIRIADQGGGFVGDDIARLTNRFERGTNVEGIVGSGLGLTIVADVVDAHGGRLDISNKPDGGACVSLFFPLQ